MDKDCYIELCQILIKFSERIEESPKLISNEAISYKSFVLREILTMMSELHKDIKGN